MPFPLYSDKWPNTGVGLPTLDRRTVAGIAVAITGNVLISLALNFQKLAHRRLEGEREQKNRGAAQQVQTGGNPALPSVLEDDHDGASTPTAVAGESDPLLPSHNGTHHYGTSASIKEEEHSSGRWGFLGRFRRSPKASRDKNTSSVHAMLPVDVVTIPPAPSPNENHTGSESESSDHEAQYLKSKLWWLGFLLMNVGEVGNFISYAFAPASVVAPLGTFALIANCLFAPLILKERFRKLDLLGIFVAVIGAITVVLSTNPLDVRLGPDALLKAMGQHAFIAYSTIYIIGALTLSTLSEREIGKKWVYVDVGLCAIFGGFTVLSTKAFSTLLTMEWFEIFTEWITYPIIAVLIGTGVGQIRYLNRALMRFDSKVVVPTQFVLFNLSAIIGSAILYGDFKRATFHQIVTFLYGCGATFAGVFMITWAPQTASEGEGVEEELEVEGAVDLEEAVPRDVRMGSLARRNRATLVIPEGVVSAVGTPILRNRHSMVSMLGLSPAQRLLLLSSSPHDDAPRGFEYEREVLSSPDTISRRRAVSWLGDEAAARTASQRFRSNTRSRENSRIRGLEQRFDEDRDSER
ncbi:DUF803-domain-containing protein [Cristinia sonorae]|uniref:DUF803-domain-containing protein n=1 Tax=Cristinia sonorae TaxID=1940300 RepID=A0A8K0UYX4_9AGAR|nr:DUF803-domain-containing protein [Cristinia sonorae]